jgi:ABC-type Zn uptake system ZnuABC Zn-binding protein ZnuA
MLRRVFLIGAALAALIPATAAAKVKVATSINDLASIVATVGGPEVEVFAIARPTSDVHRVEVLPSYMVKVSRADLYLKVGLGLDQWADGIIDGSHNSKLTIVDCSKDVPVRDKPVKADASMGDVHPFGNPHYWLDPRNGAIAARNIAEALAKADPAHADAFHSRAEAFAKDAEEAWKRGKALTDKLTNSTMITYHASWVYLAAAFDLKIVGTAEPVPGIPPTAKHLADLIQIVKAQKVPVLLQEPYFSKDAGNFLSREAGVRVVVASTSCDTPAAGSYLAHFDQVLGAIAGTGASTGSTN